MKQQIKWCVYDDDMNRDNYIKIKIYYTICEETGDRIIDTDMMIDEWNEEMNNLINSNHGSK